VSNTNELSNLFSEFDFVNTGYYEQSMFDLTSNLHWIFVGEKPIA